MADELNEFEKRMLEAQKAEEKRADASQKAVDDLLKQRTQVRENEEARRAQEQVEAGDFPATQAEAAIETPHLTEADMADESVREGKKEVDPQFAGKTGIDGKDTKERAADLPADGEATVAAEEAVVAADQQTRAALTQAQEGIADIPNAEGADAKVVDGVEKSREDNK